MTTIVADTSVIINGNLAQQIESGSIRNSDLIIPQAAVSYTHLTLPTILLV